MISGESNEVSEYSRDVQPVQFVELFSEDVMLPIENQIQAAVQVESEKIAGYADADWGGYHDSSSEMYGSFRKCSRGHVVELSIEQFHYSATINLQSSSQIMNLDKKQI